MSKTEIPESFPSDPNEVFNLAVDGMGGDGAPEVVVAGLAIAAERHRNIKVLLIGDEARLLPLLAKYPKAASICTVWHTDVSVSMDMKPTSALRMRQSSMRLAMDAVASGRAQGVVSAGNSGAMLALAKIVVKTLPGISRPAMAAISPTIKGDVVMLDLGANVACDWRNLVEFAVMGEAFAKSVLGLPAPTIGLLNIGAEELKGDEKLRVAAETLRESPLAAQFHGFVEGHDITAGTTDVVVTDGFTGNVALKTGEGVLKMATTLLRRVFQRGIISRLGYLLVRPGLERMKEWLDPRRYNGAVFVGLNGVVVKSHGGTDAEGFAAAVDVAMDMVTHGFNESIRERLSHMGALLMRPQTEEECEPALPVT
ncbi:phosphate acyltransferase PlsX [Acetobacter fabarum]|jgi:glycerol-3-phosphate acyltransferase PlsX|uniref:Phosphate acyltransferase n=1 Tax=Acetobacter fabarum TaxID=483199 RepID=A0A269XZW1_9PROT|nr:MULTISPECIES: phosphate acyltransferase PlsX [Acetobacter]MDN6713386.1 phosphate acyltransferase PlsX [Acetobacter sp.]MCH4026278.1 phosphate acyltransferase PlsX [Acetobacter fabarum]MCH4055275.1 phosphate acyltransferase PlsX [Acetobacter fabarum]MCH4085860.1 phosphate acyltransferase PlsX [Acetobacter fabarum]MCH4127548.1 phosphate acyltransferase PlsX [Acetobacter fabarum]